MTKVNLEKASDGDLLREISKRGLVHTVFSEVPMSRPMMILMPDESLTEMVTTRGVRRMAKLIIDSDKLDHTVINSSADSVTHRFELKVINFPNGD